MTTKPSDVLPPPPLGGGDSNGDEICRQVGSALSAWEGIEEAIADIFVVLTGGVLGMIGQPAQRAYGTIMTFRGRHEMVAAAAEGILDKPELNELHKQLKALLRNCADFAARRNEIAHGVVKKLDFFADWPGTEALTDSTWYLMPASYNTFKSHFDMNTTIVKRRSQDADAVALQHFIKLAQRGLGKYKYNSAQIKFYSEEFRKLQTRGIKLGKELYVFLK